MTTFNTFEALPLSDATRAALAAMEITQPTPIQARTLAPLLDGRDVIGQARTGSGKTLAFGIPLVERCRAGRGAAQALVLTPTRELASQVAGVVGTVGRGHRLRVVELVGGRGFEPQAHALRAGAEIVVGTPGRVLDHLTRGTLRLGSLVYLVLDEADEMLDQGFGPAVDRILTYVPATAGGVRQQHALFSATLPDWARAVAARLLRNPVEVRVDGGRPAGVAPESVEHLVYEVPEGAKPAVLRALLNEDCQEGSATLVFGRTRHGVRKLARQLSQEGYQAAALQSDLNQNQRDRVIASFRSGQIPILVATNVAARGLDIVDLGRVINYDLPENGALFTHRVGRTGRMGRAGQAITLLAPEDSAKWRQLEKEFKAAGLHRPFPRRAWDGPLPALPARGPTATVTATAPVAPQPRATTAGSSATVAPPRRTTPGRPTAAVTPRPRTAPATRPAPLASQRRVAPARPSAPPARPARSGGAGAGAGAGGTGVPRGQDGGLSLGSQPRPQRRFGWATRVPGERLAHGVGHRPK